MKTLFIICQLVWALPIAAAQIDHICLAYCETLVVENGVVRLIDLVPPTRTLAVGSYVASDQHLVPAAEAPIRDLRSPRGWRIVVSAFLDHDEAELRLRVRFFDPRGELDETVDILSALEDARIGRLFGGNDEIVALTSNEEHSYSSQTGIWYLPERGKPKDLLSFGGGLENLSGNGAEIAGAAIKRETYDGIHADTKGTAREFWAWNAKTRVLVLQTR
jgi:hypothetical protein